MVKVHERIHERVHSTTTLLQDKLQQRQECRRLRQRRAFRTQPCTDNLDRNLSSLVALRHACTGHLFYDLHLVHKHIGMSRVVQRCLGTY